MKILSKFLWKTGTCFRGPHLVGGTETDVEDDSEFLICKLRNGTYYVS